MSILYNILQIIDYIKKMCQTKIVNPDKEHLLCSITFSRATNGFREKSEKLKKIKYFTNFES